MISSSSADAVLLISLLISLGAYVYVSKREGSFLNVLTPALVMSIPSLYLLPWFFAHLFGTEASTYAFVYVYASLTVENLAFVYAYTRRSVKPIRFPFHYAYHNFGWLALGSLGIAFLMYVPILLQFPQYILDPRQIYAHTRTGFGINFYISSILAYLAAVLIAFSRRARWVKAAVLLGAAAILSWHGSKGQVLS